jgi:hypothetical protein
MLFRKVFKIIFMILFLAVLLISQTNLMQISQLSNVLSISNTDARSSNFTGPDEIPNFF